MTTPRSKEKLVDWQVLYDSLVSQLPDMPQFAADHKALGDVLAQARDLEKEQEAAASQLRAVNQRRRELLAQGKDLRSRLSHGLRGVLGSQDEKLIAFGVKPRPRVLRRKKAAPPAEEPGSSGSAGDSAPHPPTKPAG